MPKGKTYSVIIPVFNSEHILPKLIGRTVAVMDQLEGDYEIIAINDVSKDGSWEALKNIKAEFDQVRIVNLSNNVGQHIAIFCGLSFSTGTFAITLDDDLQIAPEDIPLLVSKMQSTNADMVYGVYGEKQHHKIRNLGSKLIAGLLKRTAKYKGNGSSFKLIKRTIVDEILKSRFEYIFLDEIIAWQTDNIAYQEVSHHKREEGKSGYSFFKLLKMSLKIILNYTVIPLRFMTWLGLLLSFICFIIGIYYIYNKINYDVPLGFTSIIVAISFSTGIILFSLGIIGEYLRRLYFTQMNKPPFTIKEIK